MPLQAGRNLSPLRYDKGDQTHLSLAPAETSFQRLIRFSVKSAGLEPASGKPALVEPQPSRIVILTRFCCRHFFCSESRYADTSTDPLSEDNLHYRFKLLELFCLPSLLGQSSQEFDWVILVDKDLPAIHLERLKQLVARRTRTYIQTHPAKQELCSLDWLREHIPPQTEWLVTVHLDDDDMLPADYLEKLRTLVRSRANQTAPTLYTVFGVSKVLFWDLHFSPIAKLGYIAPYHRSARYASCGFGFLARYPAVNYNVLGLSHVAPNWFQSGTTAPQAKFDRFLEEVERLESQGLLERSDLGRADYSASLDTDRPVVMTNHRRNVQWCRVLEYKPRTRMTRSSDLRPYSLDVDKILEHKDYFRVCLERQARFYRWKPHQLIANLVTSPLVVLRTLLRR